MFNPLPQPCRCLSDFMLDRQLYKGKASTLYQAIDKISGTVVALKSYSKRRLSDLNWYQVERGEPKGWARETGGSWGTVAHRRRGWLCNAQGQPTAGLPHVAPRRDPAALAAAPPKHYPAVCGL